MTRCYVNGNERSHRHVLPFPNNTKHIDRSMSPKSAVFRLRSGPHLIHVPLAPQVYILNGISTESAAFAGFMVVTNSHTDRQTDRQTDNDTSVTIGRTLCYTQLCHQMIVTIDAKYRTVWSAEFDASTVRHSTSTQCSTTRETPYSRWYLCQILTDFQNSFTGWFTRKFSVKWLLLVISPCLAYVATLTCETLMSENKRLTIQVQGTAVTYLRCGGTVDNQTKKLLLLSQSVKIVF